MLLSYSPSLKQPITKHVSMNIRQRYQAESSLRLQPGRPEEPAATQSSPACPMASRSISWQTVLTGLMGRGTRKGQISRSIPAHRCHRAAVLDHGLNSASILEASKKRSCCPQRSRLEHSAQEQPCSSILSDTPKDDSGGLKSTFLILCKSSPLSLYLNVFPCWGSKVEQSRAESPGMQREAGTSARSTRRAHAAASRATRRPNSSCTRPTRHVSNRQLGRMGWWLFNLQRGLV